MNPRAGAGFEVRRRAVRGVYSHAVRTAAALLLALWLLPLAPQPARAASALRLPVPSQFGVVPAATYDEHGHRIGSAHLVVEQLEGGRVRLFAESGIDGAERNVASALLERLPDGSGLRLLKQTSHSFDAAGQSLGMLRVDHVAGRAYCDPAPGDSRPAGELDLPTPDVVANVPMNLLFLPLVRGDRQEIDFELMTCSQGPRLVKATATVAERTKTEDGLRDVVEVRTRVDLGNRVLSALAAPFVPKLAVWFDPSAPGGWLAHRMPLFVKGPTVLVVRTGVAPNALEDATD